MPAVSVVLPFRDSGEYVGDAVRSVLTQDFTDFELLAIDDGSRDDSRRTIETISQCDGRVRVLDAGGRGLPAALNVGIAAARGRYIARMDADDVVLPERLTRQVAALDRDANLIVIGSAVDQIDERGRRLDTAWYPSSPASIRAALRGGRCCLCHPATMFRRDAVVSVGGYRTSVPLAEDYDLWLRLLRVGDLRNLDVPLLRYRLHRGSVAFTRTAEQVRSLLRSAVLDRDDLDPAERARVEHIFDLPSLIARLRPNEDPADVLLDLTGWYVENAVMATRPRTVRRLIGRLASLAPENRRRQVERGFRLTAALMASSNRHRLAALRFLLGRESTWGGHSIPWRALLNPPWVEVRQNEPEMRLGSPAGFLDSVSVVDEGRCLLLFGWVPLNQGCMPSQLLVVASSPARVSSFRWVRRPDVARVYGPNHLFSGFRIVVTFEQPAPSIEKPPSIWSRAGGGPWQALNDQNACVDRP